MTEPLDGVAALVGRTVDGRYRVERFVARGGFGAVFQATHAALGRAVALKVLRVPEGLQGAARDAFLASFRDEARTLAALDHPALVRVSDFGTLVMEGDAVPWMVMDWVEGITLADDLAARRGRGGRPPQEALALLRGAFEGVAAAHAAGVAHRDLKPSNLMVCASPTGPTTRVLDFGLAKLMEDGEAAGSGLTETRRATPAFTPGYAAPEQISRARTGPWTDVHALALMLTEVICDRGAYPEGDITDTTAAAFDVQRPTPGRWGVDVGAWEPLIARALALRPSERFAHAGEFLHALERASPAAAPPRRRGALAVAALGLGLGVAAVLLSRGSIPPPPAPTPLPTPRPTPRPIDGRDAGPALSDAGPARSDESRADVPSLSRPLQPTVAPARRARRTPSSPEPTAPDAPVRVEIE